VILNTYGSPCTSFSDCNSLLGLNCTRGTCQCSSGYWNSSTCGKYINIFQDISSVSISDAM
jgi:hypothetical protein